MLEGQTCHSLYVYDSSTVDLDPVCLVSEDACELLDTPPGVGPVSELNHAYDPRHSSSTLEEPCLLDEGRSLLLLELLCGVPPRELGLSGREVVVGSVLAGKTSLGLLLQ